MYRDLLYQRITLDPRVMAGKPVIRGTRIPVELIVRLVAQRMTQAEILEEYPRLQPENIQAALLYAAAVVARTDPVREATSQALGVQTICPTPVVTPSDRQNARPLGRT